MSPTQVVVFLLPGPSACASAVSGALTSEKPIGSLLIANPVSSPPPGMYVLLAYWEKRERRLCSLECT